MPKVFPGEIIGVIFPILPEHVSRLISNPKRDVFLKFTKIAGLGAGSRIVFYVSHEGVLAGEGRVKEIERLDPREAWSKYKNRVFLNKSEYDSYVSVSPISRRPRKMKTLTIFVLENLLKFRTTIKPKFLVGPSGRSLSRKMYANIRTSV